MDNAEELETLSGAPRKIKIDVSRYLSEHALQSLLERLDKMRIASLHLQGDSARAAPSLTDQQHCLTQLIDFFSRRNLPPAIRISSITMDADAIEKLRRAIYKGPPPTQLSLHNCRVGDGMAEKLFKEVAHFSQLTRLDLSGNDLTDKCAETLRHLVVSAQELKELQLNSNVFSKKTIRKVFNPLAAHGALTELRLRNCALERDCIDLLSSLLERNEKITLLDVRNNLGLNKKLSLQILYRLQENAANSPASAQKPKREHRSVLQKIITRKNISSNSLFGISEEKIRPRASTTADRAHQSRILRVSSEEISFSEESCSSLLCGQPPLDCLRTPRDISLEMKCSSCARLVEKVLKLESELSRLHLLIKKVPALHNNSTIYADADENDTPPKSAPNLSLIAPPRFDNDKHLPVEKIIKDLDLLIDVSDQKEETMEREPHLTNSYSAVYNNTVNYHNQPSESQSQMFLFGDNKTNLSCIEKRGNLSIVAEKSVFVLNDRNSGFYLDGNDKDLDLKSDVLCDKNILGQLEKEDQL